MNKYTLKRTMSIFWQIVKNILINDSVLQAVFRVDKRKLLMRIKIFTILMTVFLMEVSASSLAQKVTLEVKQSALKLVLQKLREQTGYDFLYQARILRESKPISISLTNVELPLALEAILHDADLSFSIKGKVVVIELKQLSLIDQVSDMRSAIDVSGKVVDEKGTGMPGATVIVKGTARRAVTDATGFFFLNKIAEDATLVISYLGYGTQEIKAGKFNGLITMRLSEATLSEVQVTTAYGIERKQKELGYSVSKVSGEELNRANSGSVLTGLIGKVSGLNISTQSTSMSPQMRILLRGIRSFGEQSNNQPLFILNGSPLSFGSDNDAALRAAEFLNNLNPADVEDVTVLKGANGTSMYGPEGVNGVIIITTKKPKAGEMAINFRVNSSWQALDWSQDIKQRKFGLGDNKDIYGQKSVYSWGPAYDGSMVPIGYPDEQGKYQMVKYEDRNDSREFWDIARATRTNLSLAQGDQNSSYYLGLGRVEQKGLLPGDQQNQSTVLLNNSRNFGKALNVQMNINYSRTNSDRGPGIQGEVMNTPTFIPLLNYKNYQNDHWSVHDNYWSLASPYEQIDRDRTKETTNALMGSIAANVKILSWLSIKDQIGLNYQGGSKKEQMKPISFSQYARANSQKRNDIDARVVDDMSTSSSINNDVIVTALHKVDNFMFRINAGNTIRESYSRRLKSASNLVIPVYNLIYEKDNLLSSDEVSEITRSISLFGNASIGYKDRVFLEFTGRNEWDSKRAVIARGKDLYFGANSSILLKESISFLKRQEWLSNLRLRASVALTANMNISPNASERKLLLVYPYPFNQTTTDFFGNIVNTGNYVIGYGFDSTNPNPLIKPEKVVSQEYGAEIGLFKNRLKLDASYYYQINNGVIMRVANSWMSGHADFDNAGKFQNSGWEFDANLSPLISFSKDMKISIQGRMSINNNKVLQISDLYQGQFQVRDPSGRVYFAREGHSAFEFSLTDWKRDPMGRVIVDKNSGLPTLDYENPIVKGKTLPVYQGSVTLNFNYKRFNFSVQADYSAGNSHLFDTQSIGTGLNPLTLLNNRELFVFPNSVIEDRPGHFIENSDVAVSNAGQALFSRFGSVTGHGLTSAAFWKIREFALQYELPVNTKWIKKLNWSIYARDIFSFYPSSNINGDPGMTDGPGVKKNVATFTGQRDPAVTNNLSGGSSEVGTLPGTRLFGFTAGIYF